MPNQPIEVNLQGTFFEMGKQYITQLNQIVINQLALSRKSIRPVTTDPQAQKLFDIKILEFISKVKKSYPVEMLEFFNGILQTDFAKRNSLTLDELTYLDNMYIVSMIADRKSKEHCSFIGFGLESGVVGGRNFDFANNNLQCMTDTPVILRMQHSNLQKYPNKILSIGLPGTICNPTILNNKNLFLEINTASDSIGSKLDDTRFSTLSDFLLKMMQCENYQNLHDFLISKPVFMGLNVSIAGSEGIALHTIEMSPFNVKSEMDPEIPNFKNRARAANSEDTLDPSNWDNNPNILVSTNVFRLLDWSQYTNKEGDKKHEKNFSTERYKNLIKLGREKQGCLANKPLNVIQEIMEHGFNNNDPIPGATKYIPTTDPSHAGSTSTYYTVAFKTYKINSNKTPKFSVRFQQQTSPESKGVWTKWQKYKV